MQAGVVGTLIVLLCLFLCVSMTQEHLALTCVFAGQHKSVSSSEEFPEILRGSIREDHEGRFYEDFYR